MNKQTASVLEVAKYLLEKKESLTTMKLQKLAYYCQAWSLAWDGKPLFEEEFQAWANGPVCAELFNMHRGRFVIGISSFSEIDDYNFTEVEKATISGVLDFYGDKESQWLSELTHKEAPWKDARAGLPSGMSSSKVIEKDSMQQYYGGL